jgi:hypothetical protein
MIGEGKSFELADMQMLKFCVSGRLLQSHENVSDEVE